MISCIAWKVSRYGVFSCPYFPAFVLSIFPYSVRMWGNTGQKKLRIWTLFTQCRFSWRRLNTQKLSSNPDESSKTCMEKYYSWINSKSILYSIKYIFCIMLIMLKDIVQYLMYIYHSPHGPNFPAAVWYSHLSLRQSLRTRFRSYDPFHLCDLQTASILGHY